jgi:hypothetical protein
VRLTEDLERWKGLLQVMELPISCIRLTTRIGLVNAESIALDSDQVKQELGVLRPGHLLDRQGFLAYIPTYKTPEYLRFSP